MIIMKPNNSVKNVQNGWVKVTPSKNSDAGYGI